VRASQTDFGVPAQTGSRDSVRFLRSYGQYNFSEAALNSSRVGLELKGVYDLVKAFTDGIRRRIARKYAKSPVSKSKAK